MKSLPLFGMLFCCLATAQQPTLTSPKAMVVIELFTSQGCSTCPAADELLKEFTLKSQSENKSVFGLSFHVNYWNHLGWVDPYSSEQFTKRQKKYFEVLHLPSYYTPQMVVNGWEDLVGSNSKRLNEAVDFALTNAPQYEIAARATVQDKKVLIEYEVSKMPKNEIVNVALVELSVANDVPRGENKGKFLKHYNVVRKLDSQNLKKKDVVALEIPQGLEAANRSVIIFIQDRGTYHIIGATKIDF